MIDYELKDLFYQQDIDKQLIIQYDTGTITNNEIHSESFTLEESLCSESNLRFGSCEASSISFTVSNIFEPLKDKWLDASMVLAKEASNPLQIGSFKVYSDIPTADRKKREITAYDALYDIINADVATWYKNFFTSKVPEDEEETVTYTLKEFRDSFFEYFGIAQEEISLINDEMTVEKTIQPEKLSGKTVISAICEINACFGHIGRNGNFQYVKLEPIEKGIYPSATLYPKKDLYPVVPSGFGIYTGTYISAQYEDFETELITKIQVRQEEDDIGAVSGDGDNSYVIQDNFLVYGKDAEELQAIADKILAEINGIYYKPFEAKCIGNPCLEVGDAIRLSTARASIHSYILQRKLTGVQALRDTYTADGEQEQSENVNSVSSSIIQLKGKTNKLTTTVDATISELEDLENETNTRFEQTSDEISLVAERTTKNEKSIASLNITADDIKTSIVDLENGTNSKFAQLSNEISLKVSTGDVINEINISDEAIKLSAGRLIVESGNFTLDKYGNCSMSGEINATSGSIGALQIFPNGLLLGGISGDANFGFLSNEELSINTVSAAYLEVDSISSATGGNIEFSNGVVINADLEADAADFSHVKSSYLATANLDVTSQLSASDIYCDLLNNGVPVTSANLWEYMPEITFTIHTSGGMNGAYYYGTDSTYASGDNKSIPSIQWVKNYTTSKVSSYITESDLSSYAKKTLVLSLQNDIEGIQLTVDQNADDISSLLSRVSALEAAI